MTSLPTTQGSTTSHHTVCPLLSIPFGALIINVVTRLNKAFCALPSLEGQGIKVNLNPDQKLITVLKKNPEATEWTMIETLKVPIPQCFLSEHILQTCKSKLLDAKTIAELVPKTIEI